MFVPPRRTTYHTDLYVDGSVLYEYSTVLFTTSERREAMISSVSAPAARAEDLVKRYGAGQAAVTALDGVSIEIPAGSFTAVINPSGSGKSTLLHCMAGLDTADSGRVWIGGEEITSMPDRQLTRLRRDRVGFVFQAFNLLPVLSAARNIRLPLDIAGREPDP